MLESLSSNVYIFILFSGLMCVVYYVLPAELRVGMLFAASVLFYVMCDPRFLLLVLAETCAGWFIGRRMQAANKKMWLFIGVAICIGTLMLFKYWGLLWQAVTGDVLSVLLPLGISYYTFRIVSYLADIYMGKRGSETSFLIYAVYVLFFPQLLSGPISRSEGMTDRMHEGITFNAANLEEGMRYILSGLFKKVVIADRVGGYVNTIFAAPDAYPALAAWMAAFLYTIQLYCDFAGYSEIAIGITKCYGFDCVENFRRPYLANDMKDFWRRWHISLSSWLRDYIYIPCGGSRVDTRWKVHRNVLLTFIACGLWHGAGVHYILWGLYHGVWNILASTGRSLRRRVPQIIQILVTFLIAMFGWILFKIESITEFTQYIRCMFQDVEISISSVQASILPFTQDNSCAAYASTALLMILVLIATEMHDEYKNILVSNYSNLRMGILLALVVLFGVTGNSGFLYAGY